MLRNSTEVCRCGGSCVGVNLCQIPRFDLHKRKSSVAACSLQAANLEANISEVVVPFMVGFMRQFVDQESDALSVIFQRSTLIGKTCLVKRCVALSAVRLRIVFHSWCSPCESWIPEGNIDVKWGSAQTIVLDWMCLRCPQQKKLSIQNFHCLEEPLLPCVQVDKRCSCGRFSSR